MDYSKKHPTLFKIEDGRSFLFSLGFALFLLQGFLETTMFQENLPTFVLDTIRYVGVILIAFKMLYYDLSKYLQFSFLSTILSKKVFYKPVFAVLLCAFLFSVLYFLFGSYTRPLYFIFLIIGAKDVDFDKVIKLYLYLSLTLFFITIEASLIGLIPNYCMIRGESLNYAMGFSYRTELSAHAIFIVLAFLYLNRNSLTPSKYALILLFDLAVYIVTQSRLSTIIILFALIVFLLLDSRNKNKKSISLFAGIMRFSFVFLALLSISLAVLFNENNDFLAFVDKIMTGRLYWGHQGFEQYGLSLFGQYISMQGLGKGVVLSEGDYFYLDSSYVNILLRYGIIFLILTVFIMTASCYKSSKKGNYHLLGILFLVAITSFINEHLINVTYNVFALAFLANITTQSNPNYVQPIKGHAAFLTKVRKKSRRFFNQTFSFKYQDSLESFVKLPYPVLGSKETGTLFDPCVVEKSKGFRIYVSSREEGTILSFDSVDGVNWSNKVVSLSGGGINAWDHLVNRCCVVHLNETWYMWYTGQSSGKSLIGIAVSDDGKRFCKVQESPVVVPEYDYEGVSVMNPWVVWDSEKSIFKMWYSAGDDYEPDVICYAESVNGISWKKHTAGPVFCANGTKFEKRKVGGCCVVHEKKYNHYLLFYIAYENIDVARICMAISDDGIKGWERSSRNPLISPTNHGWDSSSVYKPSAIVDKSDSLMIWYNGRKNKTEYIGLAYCNLNDLKSHE